MTGRVLAVALIVIGSVLTAAGLFGQFVLTEDEGHHDGREPTFALETTSGADQLLVDAASGSEFEARIERAGQVLVDYDTVHDARFHVFTASSLLDHYSHTAFDETTPDGVYASGSLPDGDHRLVVQAAPSGGPDLLELGSDVTSTDGGVAGLFLGDEEWTDDTLTVTRQGLDFVLSEPWTGEDHMGGPAFLAMFREGDLAFVHGHARLIGDDRFSFAVDLPGRGEYLAALEFVQDGELVTALYRFEV